jgi:aryl-alcohol dehydrogenase-like predicted oxidoreductase
LLRTLEDLKREGKVRSWGISVNRWEPTNVLKALATGLIDSVQVVYNIFDQAPEDELFPYCLQHGIAIIARVPFDEGSLTGTLTPSTRWPDGDWRNLYFPPAHLAEALEHVERLKPLVPPGMTLPGAGAPLHPAPSRRDDSDSGYAEDRERAGELRRQ